MSARDKNAIANVWFGYSRRAFTRILPYLYLAGQSSAGVPVIHVERGERNIEMFVYFTVTLIRIPLPAGFVSICIHRPSAQIALKLPERGRVVPAPCVTFYLEGVTALLTLWHLQFYMNWSSLLLIISQVLTENRMSLAARR